MSAVDKRCEACGKPADDPQLPGLCVDCAATIDRDYERLRDLADLDGGL
jgi:threonine synthase